MNRKEEISLADAKGASPVAQSKESGCNAGAAGDLGWEGLSLGWEDRLEEGMVIHSSILAWRIP